MDVEETRQAYRDMIKVMDERMVMKLSELTLRLAQNAGQLFLRKATVEEQLEAIKEAIAENRGAATVLKEIEAFQTELQETRERERQMQELKREKREKEVGQRTLDS